MKSAMRFDRPFKKLARARATETIKLTCANQIVETMDVTFPKGCLQRVLTLKQWYMQSYARKVKDKELEYFDALCFATFIGCLLALLVENED